MGDGPLDRGRRLSVLTWICPEKPASPNRLVRYIVRDVEPLFRFEATPLKPAADCYRIEDSVLTVGLEPGEYVYHIRWTQYPNGQPVEGLAPPARAAVLLGPSRASVYMLDESLPDDGFGVNENGRSP